MLDGIAQNAVVRHHHQRDNRHKQQRRNTGNAQPEALFRRQRLQRFITTYPATFLTAARPVYR